MKPTTLLTATLAMLPASVLAHAGDGASGLLAGLLHPLHGADHLLVMVAVGLWAATLGGQALWRGPLTFVALMLSGALLALGGLALPMVEPMIALSALVMGLLLIAGTRMGAGHGLMLIGLFALFHGFAHGAEAPTMGIAAYLAGFVLSTGALHFGGVLTGRWLRIQHQVLVRLGGGATLAGASIWLLAGI